MKRARLFCKILAVSLVLVMVLAACASPSDSGSGANPGDNNNPPSDFNDVTLKMQLIGDPQPDISRISNAVSEYLKSIGKPYSVELNIESWGSYTDNINLRLAVGEEFDVCFISNWAADYYSNAANGNLTELGPYLAKYPEVERILTADFMNASQVDGKNYALPTNKEKARQLGWVVRKDIADAMGMDISAIKSVADLEPWIYKAKEEHDMWSFPIFIPSDYQFDRIVEPIIGTRVETGSKTVIAPDLEPEYINAVKMHSKWFADGIINPNLNRESSGDEEFKTGKYFAIPYQLKPGKDGELTSSLNIGQLVQIPMNQPEIANSETTGAMMSIPAASKNKNEAFDFISLLYTDAKLVNLIVWGEEGTDFDFVEKDKVITNKESGWGYGNGWTMGDQFKNYLTENEDPTKWDQFIAFNEAGRPLPALGFVPDTGSTDMQTWISGMRAVRERYDDLFKGYVPLDEVDAKFAQLESEYKTAGMDELIAALQEQFDAFLASK